MKKRVLRVLEYNLFIVGVRNPEVRDEAHDLNAYLGSWLTQISFHPPLLAVAVRKDGRSYGMIRDSGVLAVSFLAQSQKAIASAFLRDVVFGPGTMHGIAYRRGATGAPWFPALAGAVECEVRHEWDRGDHSLFVVEVVDAHAGEAEGSPLTTHGTGWHYGG